MKISFSKSLAIVILSSLLGLLINSVSSRGIPLIYKEREIGWGNDSLVNLLTNKPPSDTSTIEESSSEISKTLKAQDEKSPRIMDKSEIKENTFTPVEPVKINIETAYNLFNKNILFVDARPVEDFSEGHIKGALSIPYYSDDLENLLSMVNPKEPVVVYCNGTDCDLSIMLGNKMFKLGYEKVFVFFGGWDEWLKKDFPRETAE